MDQELLKILCCPQTKVPLDLMADDELAKWNNAIQSGQVKQVDGTVVKKRLSEALITRDHKTIYRVDDGIPIMLTDQGISADQV